MNKPVTMMTVCALLILGLATSGLCAEKHPLVRNLEAGQTQTVVAYGTSLTTGWPDEAGGGWVALLAAELNRRFPGLAKVINNGQGAQYSKWGVDNLQSRVLDKKPDAVFIEFSINDAYVAYKTSVAQARENLETMVDRIRAQNPKCFIILMVMNPPVGVHLESRPEIEAYNQMYREVAARRKLTLVDHYPNWQAIQKNTPRLYQDYVPDGIHPNAKGCREVILPSILRGLGLTADVGAKQ